MHKACPVVVRNRKGQLDILAFLHPIAGKQLVKGTIEPDETLKLACERELFEESGLELEAETFIGALEIGEQRISWGFYLMRDNNMLQETWSHFTADDGGLLFSFFWQPIEGELLEVEWHPSFVAAIEFIRKKLL